MIDVASVLCAARLYPPSRGAYIVGAKHKIDPPRRVTT
ncbi:hypothetical protein ACVIGB_001831 [Bradyrhizobium sp. USDA 4341]